MSFQERRQAMVDALRRADREPFHETSRDYPSAYADLAHDIQTAAPRLGKCYTDVATRAGLYGDDFEKQRSLLAKGIPPAELTNRFGESCIPHLA